MKRDMQRNPNKSVHDVIEDCKSGKKITELKVMVTHNTNDALESYKKKENINSREEAAASLIEDSLIDRGFLTDG